MKSFEALPELPQPAVDSEFILAQGHAPGDESAKRVTIVAVPKSGEGPIFNLLPEIEIS